MDAQPTTHQRKRRGFNLIEAAIVLGVVGLVIGGIWVASAAMYESYKVNKTVEGILTIARNVQELISYRDAERLGHLYPLSLAARKSSAIPEDWIKNDNIKSPLGGAVSLRNLTDFNYARFNISLSEVTKSECISLVVRISSISEKRNNTRITSLLRLIHINYGHPEHRAFPSSTFPIPTSEADSACLDLNKIIFPFNYVRTN